MNYFSTRGQVEPVGFADAVMMGLADVVRLLPSTLRKRREIQRRRRVPADHVRKFLRWF